MAYVWFGLFVVALFFAIKHKIALLTITTYMAKKHAPPTDLELRECANYVIRNLFK